METNNNGFNEIMVCELVISTNINIAVVVLYRPPNASVEFNDNLRNVLYNIMVSCYTNVVLLGDLNAPGSK